MDLTVVIPSPDDSTRTSYVMISRGKESVHGWKFTFPMPNSEPVQNFSLNFRKQKEENLAWHSRRLASRRLFAAHVPSQTGVKETCADTLIVSPCLASLFSHKEPFLRPRGSGKLFLPIHRMEVCQQRFPKWLQEWCVMTIQDERQLDAALHWDTIGPVLLKAFAKTWAQDFSEKHWLRLIHQGGSKTRFEYCQDSKKPWLTSEQFKDTLAEWPLTLSWWGTLWFLTIGRNIFCRLLGNIDQDVKSAEQEEVEERIFCTNCGQCSAEDYVSLWQAVQREDPQLLAVWLLW